MIYVGIDVASEKHDCCIIDENSSVLKKPFTIANSREGFDALAKTLLSFADASSIRIGLEATGIYGDNLSAYLIERQFNISTLNPLTVHKHLCATSLRKTKTDRIDASFIAQYMRMYNVQPDTAISYHIRELKSLTRYLETLVARRAENKECISRLLKQIFPEYKKLFKSVHSASAYALFRKFPSAKRIAYTSAATLLKCLNKASRGRWSKDKVAMLIQVAKSSIGRDSNALSLQLCDAIDSIKFISSQINSVDKQIRPIVDSVNLTLLSIPGIGYRLAACILAEIGDISRFSSSAKLLAFAGLDPSVSQSGKHEASGGRMVKRGSPHLRRAIMLAAKSTSLHCPSLRSFLANKRKEGKHYFVALSHTARKLVRLIFAILFNNVPFDPNLYPVPS